LNKCIREAKEKYGHEGKDAQRESKKREQSSGLRDDYTAHCVSAYSSILRDDCVDLELPTSPIAPPGLETTSAPVLVPAPQPTKGGEKMTIEEDQDVDLDFSTILEAAEDSFGNDVDFSPRKDGGGRNQGRSGSITSRGEIGALGSSVYTPRQSTSASQINAITPLLHPSLNGLAATNLPEPAQHGPISRAFVKTMHSLSKWKRVLNNRSAITTPLTCADASAFDVEFSATGDLLIVKGGVEQYLKWLEVPHSTTNLTDGMRSTHTLTDDSPSELAHDTTDDLFVTGPVFDPPQLERPSVHESRSSTFVSDLAAPHSEADDSEPETPDHAESIVRPEIISLDEFELSDSDESQAGGRAPRRLPRRLPLRRDLEFMRQSVDTISSLGALQEADYRDSIHSTSAVSDTSEVSSSGRGAPILEWQMNLIESDEDEPGDAEAALRKLEGQIDVARQAAKAQKVASWMKTVEERRAAGETAEVSAVDDSSIVDEEHENEREPDGRSSIDAEQPPSSAPVSPLPNEESQPATAEPRSSLHNSLYPTPESRDSSTPTPSDMGSVLNMPKSQRKLSNMASTQTLTRSSLLQKASILTSVNNRTQPSGKFSLPAMPAVHRSFILSASSDSLAHQFCLIERDLLLRIKLGEVVSMKWLEHTEKTLSVVDWIPFYKDRMKQKSKADHTDTFAASDLFTSRARFTLMVNFTASEIVLTHPTERVVVISKFIRLAWVSLPYICTLRAPP
jgi:GDP/GTP exchange factor required for growth at low temperature